MLKCPECGSEEFHALLGIIIEDVAGTEEDILANRTVSTEKIYLLECNKCSHVLRQNPLTVHVIVGLMGGLIEDISGFLGAEADAYEKKLCKTYELPYDPQKRHDHESENQVCRFILEVK